MRLVTPKLDRVIGVADRLVGQIVVRHIRRHAGFKDRDGAVVGAVDDAVGTRIEGPDRGVI